MTNKALFFLVFFSLTLVEIGQMAFSQEQVVIVNATNIDTKTAFPDTTNTEKQEKNKIVVTTDCQYNTNTDMLLSKIEHSKCTNSGKRDSKTKNSL